MVTNRFGRITSHLEGPAHGQPIGYVSDCLEAVEQLFGGQWLDQPDGHRLQKLWARKDWLATCELFGLGKSIQSLLPKHEGWLRKTAKKIKSGAANAHGFITEILVCGSISVREGEVYPSSGNQKGFDLIVDFPSKFKYYISIKSQGMATHEAEFHHLGDQLKDAFANRMNQLGVNGELYIESQKYIEPKTLQFLINFVANKLVREDQYTREGCTMIFRKMPKGDKEYASCNRSNLVFIKCPQHRNALLNAKDKLKEAAENLKKALPISDEYVRHLLIRVHSTTDLAVLEEAAKVMLEDSSKDYGFDGVHFMQPSVARDDEKSHIVTHWKFVGSSLHQGFKRAVAEGKVKPISINLPVGLVSNNPSEIYITNGKDRIPMPSGLYFYQKADIYHLMEQDGNSMIGEWSSPASGVRHHLVLATDNQETMFPSPGVEVDETLII